MGTESFDNKIKDKLQEYHDDFQEQDWERFAPLLRSQNSWWLRNRIKLAASAAALLLLLLAFQNYRLWNINSRIKAELKDRQVVKPETGSLSPARKDTIYIVREHYIYSNQGSSKSAGGKMNTQISSEKTASTSKMVVGQYNRIRKDTTLVKTEKTSLDVLAKDLTHEEDNAQLKTTIDASKKTTADETQTTDAEQKSTPTLQKELEKKPAISTEKVVSESEANTLKTPLRKGVSGQNSFAAGLSALLQDDYVAAGLTTLYTRGKHFQLSAGLQYGQGFHESYRDNEAFRVQHKSDFRDKFNQPLPSNVTFTDIHSSSEQWSVPISIYYKFPIAKRFELFAGAGSTIHLKSTQNFNYRYAENGSNPVDGVLPVQQSRLRMSHVMCSAGVQMSIKSYILRIEPMLALGNNPGRGERAEPGFRVSALYKF